MARSRRRRYETARAISLGRIRRRQTSVPVWLRWFRGVSLLLLALGVAGGLWLALDDRFYIYHADVVGAERVIPEDIFRASALPGLHILWMRPAKIEAGILSAVPSLKRAQVVCRLPARCVITVEEREPRVVWREAAGTEAGRHLWWIDADGVVFPALGGLSEGWEVRGPLPRDEDGQLEEDARVALTELISLGVNLSPVFYYEPGRGFVFVDEVGRCIVLGEGPGMEERLRVLEALIDDLEARGVVPRFVDVRFPEAPYYSLTNDR